MPMETRSSSALFKRAEQLKRWLDSETNQEEPVLGKNKRTRIKFSDGCVFLAACSAGDKDEVERLLSLGADINTANVDGLTALHQACIDDNLDMVEFLVEHNCDLNRGDNEGWTPLHATASCGFVSIARYLIEKGSDVAAVNNDGDLPIDIGESVEIEELLQAEIERLGIDCDSVRQEEEQIMLEDAKQWLNSGHMVGPMVHPKTGATSLHVAAAKGYINVMSLLIQAGADLNMQDNDGWTPLHAAAHWGQREACELLAENLANMDIQNFSGQSCFDVSDSDLVKVLEDLKKKQATLSQEKPEIQEILQRKAPPPLKRRTSVTRMSGAEKSSAVMKDSFAERAQIQANNLRLDEEEEEEKKAGSPTMEETFLPTGELNEIVTNGKEEITPEPSTPTIVLEEKLAPVLNKELVTPKTMPPLIPKAEEASQSKTVVSRKEPCLPKKKDSTSETPPSTPPPVAIPKTKTNLPMVPKVPKEVNDIKETKEIKTLDEPKTPELEEGLVNEENESMLNRRVFAPPIRDDESEAQRKAHAKRVRETRRSTQGVTLEDLKSAEQQLLRKQQEEDERKEQEKETPSKDLVKTVLKPAPVTIKTATLEDAKVKERVPSSPTSSTGVERRSWRTRADSNEEEKIQPRRPLSDLNQQSSPTIVATPTETGSVTTPTRTRQRPLSAPPDTPEDGPFITLSLRTRPKLGDLNNDEDEKGDREKSGDEKSTQGTQAAIQRRRRPKRRSTGVVYLEGESPVVVTNDINKTNSNEDIVGNAVEEVSGDRALRNRSTRSNDGENTSRLASLNSSTSSLNEDADRDYKMLYNELKDENERLKIKLKNREEELEVTKRQLERTLQNNKNSMSDAEKREKRALERRLSEMEEESKEMERLTADNQRLRDENGALIRVISKLSK